MTSSDHLRLTPAARDEILAHARASDDEVCGVLAGRRRADGVTRTPRDAGDTDGDFAAESAAADSPADRVTAVRRVPNAASNPRTRYELDPEAALSAVEAVESEGRDVVGFYHSHPAGPPRPSETDRAAATWVGYVYAIAVPPETVRAWRWTGDDFEPLSVRVDG